MKPIISIILPTYNGGGRIVRSIQSVQQQSFQDWELIIIIDGSTDATFERVVQIAQNDPRIVILNNEKNQGIQKALNNGLKKSQGKYIARIDDDDQWIDTQKLQKQYDFLENNSDYVLVGTGMIVIDNQGKGLGRYVFAEKDEDLRKKILGQNCFAHPSVLFRKNIVDELEGYSEKVKYKHVEDHELWLRMGQNGKFANISEYSLLYTVDNASLSGKNKSVQLKKRLQLCIKYRKQYPNFILNLLKISFIYLGYITIGWMFSQSVKVRGFVTSLYKKIF